MENSKKFRYLYDNVPVPRRTAYRRRREAQLAARNQEVETDSEPNVEPSHQHGNDNYDCSSSDDKAHTSESSASVDSSSQSPRESNVALDNSSGHSIQADNIHNIRQRLLAEVQNYVVGEAEHSPAVSDCSQTSRSAPSWSDRSFHSEGGCDSPHHLPEQHQHDNDNQRDGNVLLNEQLCPCTPTTEGDAMLMCLALGLRHNLSWLAVVDILKMINVLFNNEVMHASKYYLKKHFYTGNDSAVCHVYCPKCELYLGTKDSVTDEQMKECRNCEEKVKDFASSSSYFVAMNLKNQFRNFMELPGIAKEISTYRYERSKGADDSYDDIYDGQHYRSLTVKGGLLSDNKNFSVIINTDGLSLGMSTSQSAWPIFLSVNELSPKNRKKHLIFAAIWVGKKAPNMGVFLKPFVDSMNDLTSHGFEWSAESGEIKVSRVVPLLSLLDSGARYKYLNLSSYTSYFGCTFCYHKAVNTTKGRRFCVLPEPAPLRTHDSMCRDMVIAHENRNHRDKKKRIYKGCKGITPLVLLEPYHDLGVSMIVDYLHNALLGCTRAHIYQSLRVNSGKKFYIGEPEKMHYINERLLLIQPPTSITRLPRDLKDVKYYRANEWRSFLLFYGIVCMEGVMSREDLEHFSMLSSAFYILLQKSISPNDLEVAHSYLLQYVYFTEKYHGQTAMTYNNHLLTHVTQNVVNFGPLFAQNMFAFEGENRHLGQMLTSPGRVALQLTYRYLTISAFPRFCEVYASSEKCLDFIEDITGKKLKHYLRCGEAILMGSCKEVILTDDDIENLAQGDIHPTKLFAQSYEKVLYGSIRYTTRAYSEGKRNDDSWIKFSAANRGRIERILHLAADTGNLVVFMVQEMRTARQPLMKTRHVTVLHIKRIEEEGQLVAIQPKHVLAQCIFMNLDTGRFIVDIPYGCYGD